MNLKNSFEKVYKEKTIQRSWKFLVTFEDFTPAGSSNSELLPKMKDYHVRSVTIPSYRFRKENMDYNNLGKTFLLFDSKMGVDLRIEMDEDAQGQVAALIRYLQRKIMNQDGTYNAPDSSKLNRIQVDILSNENEVTSRYWFNGCAFYEAEDIIYSYDSGENIKTVVTFSVDYVTVEPVPEFKG